MFEYTKKKFANDIINAAKAIDPDCRPIYIESDSAIEFPSDGQDGPSETIMYLDGTFRQWKDQSRKRRLHYINSALEHMLCPVELSNNDRIASLRLRARTIEEVYCRLNGCFADNEHQPIVYMRGSLALELVEDAELQVAMVHKESLDTLQLNEDQAYKIAAAALVRESQGSQWRADGDLWVSDYNDDYDFARLVAATDKYAALPFDDGHCVAYAPSHAVCLVTNKQDAETLAQMIAKGDELSANQRPLSKKLWTLDDSGNWVNYRNESDRSVTPIVKMQEFLEHSEYYIEQKDMLEKNNEANGLDIFIASYIGMQNSEGDVFTSCTYILNLPTFLPEVDIVNVYDSAADKVMCELPWQEFCLRIGASLKKLDEHFPARYGLTEPLGDEQIALLQRQHH